MIHYEVCITKYLSFYHEVFIASIASIYHVITKYMRLTTYIQTRHQISRRNFVALINQGYVSVNGKKVDSYTQEIQTGDKIAIKSPKFSINETVQAQEKSSKLILLNKPKGYVASKADPHNKTIYDILPPEFKNYYYIWRLDKDSHWLLLLTDDPGLVNDYEHPKNGIEKEYDIQLDNDLSPKDIQRAMSGIKDEDELLRAIKITRLKKYMYRILLNEWKKRHIRRMFLALGYRVLDLQRIREGEYKLGDIKLGERKII